MTTHRTHEMELYNVARRAASPNAENPANLGRRTPMQTSPAAGGFTLQPTSLISQRLQAPQQLLITMMTLTKGPNGVSPWAATFNGTTNAPSGLNNQVPMLPDGGRGLRARIRWGAGGAAMETEFDFPAAGAAFGVTADTIDLQVTTPNVGSPYVYASLDAVPQVGAWMCAGAAADPSPLRWLEPYLQFPNGAALYYAVKPFARRVRVACNGLLTNAAGVIINFSDIAGNLLAVQELSTQPNYPAAAFGNVAAIVEVPSEASVMKVTNQTGGVSVFGSVEWQIGLV